MKRGIAMICLAGFVALEARPASAQAAPDPFPYLLVTREEVKAGKGPSHTANEAAWAAAMLKGQSPTGWLGMTAIVGPSDAWYITPYQSFAAWAKTDAVFDSMAALKAENDRFANLDADLLTRTSSMLVRYRADLSYQPQVSMPRMRYMMVDVMRVKAGQGDAFTAGWRMQVAAHKTARMDEHWAVYEVAAGGPGGTVLFFYPMASLEAMDASGPMHGGDAFRDAVGEAGRNQMRAVNSGAVDSTQRLIFQLRPEMSVLPAEWAATDAFWAVKPPAPAAPPGRKPAGQDR
jgi:hypothetical protein